MLRLIIVFLSILYCSSLYSQRSKTIAISVCECIGSIDQIEMLEDTLLNCLGSTTSQFLLKDTTFIFSFENLKKTISEVKDIIPNHCYTVRKLIIEQKKKEYYNMSEIAKANTHFNIGNEFLDNENYKSAIKEFKKAIKNDGRFVFAIDHLALSYRNNLEYKKAINYYLQSLDIFPEGNVALQNIAVAYSYIKDLNSALSYYDHLIFCYPNNAEGYYGKSEIQLLNQDYEDALNSIFTAYNIYKSLNSRYLNDAKLRIDKIYGILKKVDNLKLFNDKAKEYNYK